MNGITVLWIVLGLVVLGGAGYGVARWSARGRAGSVSAMRARNLMGRDVVTISDAGKVGAVNDVLFDATGRDVIGFRVRRGRFGRGAGLVRDQVAAIGPDAIMVAAPTALNDLKRLPAQADALRLDKLRGTTVVTEAGEVLGTVSDLEVDGQAQHVLAYVLRGTLMQRMRHRQPAIPVWQVTHRGDRGLMVVGQDSATTSE
jgi:uncharacterized protein YrrD